MSKKREMISIGMYGLFIKESVDKHGYSDKIETEWLMIEKLMLDEIWTCGIYNVWNVITWAKMSGILTHEEYTIYNDMTM
jgi:hypothetical protein